MNKVIDVRDVSWRRNRQVILNDIDWEISEGQHWALLGLNGSGKTTLLNLLNGYIWPTTGHVRVLNEWFGKTDLRELRKRIGWVSSSLQERVKLNQPTQNVVVSGKYASTGLYDKPTDADFRKAFKVMEEMNCSYLYDRIYETCSNGEKQKLLIARSLMASPELLILDEPSNGLDFISREELMTSINQLAKQAGAPTIIFVTHHIEEILPIFSHTLLLREGSVFDKGKSKDVLSSSKLSSFFEKPVQVEWRNSRPFMTLLHSYNH